MTSASKLRESVNIARSQFDPDLVRVMMELPLPQFVWIVEISSAAQWNSGHVATRVIIDATASPSEDDPVFLMYDQARAHFFDRGGSHAHQVITLNSPSGVALSRMKGNLDTH